MRKLLPLVVREDYEFEQLLTISLEQLVVVKSFIEEFPLLSSVNVGKSSLLNNLLREDKAIVTNIMVLPVMSSENTSTSTIVPLRVDTAGIRETDDRRTNRC